MNHRKNGTKNLQMRKDSGLEEQVKYPLHRDGENVQMAGQREPPLETLFWVLVFALAVLVVYILRRLECRLIRQNRERAPPGSYRIR